MASIKISEIKEFAKQLKEIDEGFEVDVQYWIIWGKAAVRKQYRVDNEFVELAIYYNYNKDLVSRISKNRVISEGDGCIMTTPILTINEDFTKVKQASKKNVLEKVRELKNIDLKQYM